jgi:hypothetical protein
MQDPMDASGSTGGRELGTLWKLTRNDDIARCALLAGDDGWQLQLRVKDYLLSARTCAAHDEVFNLAAEWRAEMLERGWSAVPVVLRRRPDRRRGRC